MARGVLGDIVKRGRGHGIAVFLATQNVSDFQGLEDLVLENVSNLVILSNGDMKFWEEVGQRFVFLSKEEIRTKLMYLKRGEALVRLSNDPQTLICPFGYVCLITSRGRASELRLFLHRLYRC